VMAPALAFVSFAVVLRIVTSLDRRRSWVWQAAFYTVCFVASMLVGGVAMLGLMLAATPAIQVSPELVAIFRERCPSGVSPATWSLCAAEAVLWGLYGWVVSDTALVGYGLVTAAGSMLILGRWFAIRDRFAQCAVAKTSASPPIRIRPDGQPAYAASPARSWART
jgi:hypothetical protein